MVVSEGEDPEAQGVSEGDDPEAQGDCCIDIDTHCRMDSLYTSDCHNS